MRLRLRAALGSGVWLPVAWPAFRLRPLALPPVPGAEGRESDPASPGAPGAEGAEDADAAGGEGQAPTPGPQS